MQQMDEFASSLLEESKRFWEKAKEEARDNGDVTASNAYLHASLLLAFSALEAHVNAISDEFGSRPELTVHELGILKEREVRLEKGRFRLQESTLKIFRLEDRIELLYAKFSGSDLDYLSPWWGRLKEATKLRNQLTHPKNTVTISADSVGQSVRTIIETIDALYRAIYGTGLPVAGMQLDSKLDF